MGEIKTWWVAPREEIITPLETSGTGDQVYRSTNRLFPFALKGDYDGAQMRVRAIYAAAGLPDLYNCAVVAPDTTD